MFNESVNYNALVKNSLLLIIKRNKHKQSLSAFVPDTSPTYIPYWLVLFLSKVSIGMYTQTIAFF